MPHPSPPTTTELASEIETSEPFQPDDEPPFEALRDAAGTDAERALLGACLIHKSAFAMVYPQTNPGHMNAGFTQKVFRAMERVHLNGAVIDLVTVCAADRSLEPADVAQLAGELPTSVNVEYYGKVVRQRAMLRRIAWLGRRMTSLASQDDQTPDRVVSETQRLMTELAELAEPIDRAAFEDLQAFQARVGRPPSDLVARHWDLGAVGFVDGQPGGGKSWFTDSMALAVAAGRDFLDRYPVRRGPVAFWLEEGPAYQRAARLDALRQGMGIAHEEVEDTLRILGCRGMRLDDERDVLTLRRQLEKLMPALLVIDHLSKIHLQDENDNTAMTALLRPLDDWARDLGTAIQVIHHDRKPNGVDQNGGHNLRGAQAFNAWWRCRVLLARAEQPGVFVVTPERKDGDAPPPYLIRLERIGGDAGSARLVWDGPVVDARHAEVDVKLLQAVIALEQQAWVNNIAHQAGVDKKAAVAGLKRLVEHGRLETYPGETKRGQQGVKYRPKGGGNGA